MTTRIVKNSFWSSWKKSTPEKIESHDNLSTSKDRHLIVLKKHIKNFNDTIIQKRSICRRAIAEENRWQKAERIWHD